MRKGVVGDWRNHLTPEQNAEFDAIYAEEMKSSGLDFDFNFNSCSKEQKPYDSKYSCVDTML